MRAFTTFSFSEFAASKMAGKYFELAHLLAFEIF
jgi:hypothetical protein